MLRTLPHLNAHLQRQGVLAQIQVRLFRGKVRPRKPRWMPRAPSKLFELPKHPYVSDEEKSLYVRLVRHYENEIRSIQEYFRSEQARIEAEKGEFSKTSIEEEELFEQQLSEIERQNQLFAERRKEDHERAFQEHIAELRSKADAAEAAKQKELENCREMFKIKTADFHCITQEDLDEAIERALDTPTSHNFAITLTGEKIYDENLGKSEKQ